MSQFLRSCYWHPQSTTTGIPFLKIEATEKRTLKHSDSVHLQNSVPLRLLILLYPKTKFTLHQWTIEITRTTLILPLSKPRGHNLRVLPCLLLSAQIFRPLTHSFIHHSTSKCTENREAATGINNHQQPHLQFERRQHPTFPSSTSLV